MVLSPALCQHPAGFRCQRSHPQDHPGVVAGTWVAGASSLSYSQGLPFPGAVRLHWNLRPPSHWWDTSECFPTQVNGTSFQNLTREEAVQYLMKLPPGEDVTLWIQSKQNSE